MVYFHQKFFNITEVQKKAYQGHNRDGRKPKTDMFISKASQSKVNPIPKQYIKPPSNTPTLPYNRNREIRMHKHQSCTISMPVPRFLIG
jgi:ribosomal protein L13E